MPNRKYINGHRYYDCGGEWLPGVTSVLGATKPDADREALARWKAKVGEAEAARIGQEACDRGTALHSAIENYFLFDSLPTLSPEVQPFWDSIAPVLADLQPTELERFVWSQRFRYAGTLDCLGTFRDRLVVADFKTASKPKRLDWIGDYLLQGVAYAAAAKEQGLTTGVDGISILIALPHEPAQVFELSRAEMLPLWSDWQRRVEQFWAV